MLDERSRERIKGVDEKLVKVVEKASGMVPFPTRVIEGVRTQQRQEELYAQGRTKPGKIVTWTLNSKHIEGKAVDFVPFVNGAIPWNDVLLFTVLGKAMLEAAKELDVPIRWGYDWDGDGKLMEKGEYDGPHYELA